MIRCPLLQAQTQEFPQPQRIRYAVGDPALRIDPFQVADEEAAEVSSRCDGGPPHPLGVVFSADPLRVAVKLGLLQNLVHPAIKRMLRVRLQLSGLDPERNLFGLLLTQCHDPSLRPQQIRLKMFWQLYPRTARTLHFWGHFIAWRKAFLC